ncbi:MAG: amino acid adenylation domain-containing protein [Acidobacteria bacterium]|nr:amino acid adenylation domain-containing protein [Acidobacteriota bacterium]
MLHLLPRAVDIAARRFPEREAVRCSGAFLTYAELASRANGLAQVLRYQGLKRGDRVGIFMNKSLDSAVAMHGIMKAGGAYVPLDPFAPTSRVAFMIRDCGIRHLVTTDLKLDQTALLAEATGELSHLIGATNRDGYECLAWDDVRGATAADPPDIELTEQDLAYILYTSGSTGTPKGIVHTHRSGLSFAVWAAETYGLSCEDRISNHAPLHFDLSTFDFFAAAVAAAATVIVPEAISKLPASLSGWIERERISVWYSVPFALMQLLERGGLQDRDLSSLRWVLFAGEVFPTKHLRRVMAALPHARFSNLYGPTETNVCTFYHVPPLPPGLEEAIPIGKPCANVESLIVDGENAPVKPGETGELLIRGGVVMRGYWGRPDLNERGFFRRRVFNDQYEDVFYRTGDLVRLIPDGNLKYLGRKDRQIKTRGYRVELDEVEAALLSFPGVEEAAAFPVPDGQGSCLIEAAVTAKAGSAPTGPAVLNHVSGKLPSYAVPVKVEVLASFPRTSTGKIDRRKLQERAGAGSEGEPKQQVSVIAEGA